MKKRWREFGDYCQDILIDFLKTAIIYLLFYASTYLLSFVVTSSNSQYRYIIEAINFWTFIVMFTTVASISLTRFGVALCLEIIKGIMTVRSEQQGWMSYLPIKEDIQTQTMLLKDSSSFRMSGLRFNTALKRIEFCNALCRVQNVKLLMYSKIVTPKNDIEMTHNKKFDDSIKTLGELVLTRGQCRITVKEIEKFPKMNILIFDDVLARVKKYDIDTWSAKKSPIVLYHRLTHRNTVLNLIQDFDEMFSVAREVELPRPKEREGAEKR